LLQKDKPRADGWVYDLASRVPRSALDTRPETPNGCRLLDSSTDWQ